MDVMVGAKAAATVAAGLQLAALAALLLAVVSASAGTLAGLALAAFRAVAKNLRRVGTGAAVTAVSSVFHTKFVVCVLAAAIVAACVAGAIVVVLSLAKFVVDKLPAGRPGRFLKSWLSLIPFGERVTASRR